MTEHRVGAAVVFDSEGPGPGIITQRDLLHSNGRGEDPDSELVRDHLADELIYAYADWSLEQAAEAMTRGGLSPRDRAAGRRRRGHPLDARHRALLAQRGASCDLAPQGAAA